MKTKPLNNNCLIEVLRDDDGVTRTDASESMNYGIVIDIAVSRHHLTASAAIDFGTMQQADIREDLKHLVGKVVRWEEFAEGGQTFEEEGKTYALIPWWRLIGYEQE